MDTMLRNVKNVKKKQIGIDIKPVTLVGSS